ncbi:hypothetical protein FCV25MIE_15061 [Fagus crenata]
MVTMKPSNGLSNIEKSCCNVATNATNFSQNKTVSYFNFTKVVEALNETQSPYDFNKLAEGLCVAEKAEVAMNLKPLKDSRRKKYVGEMLHITINPHVRGSLHVNFM